MSGPPDNIPPSELWTKLMAAERPCRVVDFPRKDPTTGEPIGKVALWVLSIGEIIAAKADAATYARQLIKEKVSRDEYVEGYQQVWDDASAVEVLWRAARRPEDTRHPAFPTPSAARQRLTSDELAVLMNQYAQVQHELGPIVANMTEPEMEAWLKRLEEGGSADPLAFCSSEQLRALVMYSAFRLHKSETGSSSDGEPLGGTASD